MTKLVNQNTELNEMLNSVGPNESVYKQKNTEMAFQ